MEPLFEYKDNDLFFHHSVDIPPHDMLYGMHIHEIYEIYYLISGTGEFITEGNSYSITPGCIILLKSNEAHHIRMNTNERYERIVLHFYPDILDGITNGKALLIPFDRPLGVNNLFLPSADADNQCGFSDYTSFFRAYKKHFGTAPSDNS